MNSRHAISDLDAHLGFWLRYVSNHVSQGFAARLAGKGVTAAEWVVLRSLFGAADRQPSHLAEALGMTRGAISKLVERLMAKDLLCRRASESDGRAHVLSLTKKGETLVPELAALADENDAAFFGGLSVEERALLEGLLKRLVQERGMRSVPVE
jgi:MarR family transcriptional regulator, lower aerobic nicotinate degradation pathway regulator